MFKLSRLHVSAAGRALVFSVAVSHVPPNDRATLSWSIASVGGSACENPSVPGGTRSRNGLVVWDEQGSTFRWDRGSGACTGIVSVVAENQYEHCTAKAVVSARRVAAATPACALGGYEIGFSTLPVPAGLFHAYSTIQARLGGPRRGAAAAAQLVRDALQAQYAAFKLFPPVWFCNFARISTPIVNLRVDLMRGTDNRTAVLAAQAAGQALASCAPASVQRAFRQLAASARPEPKLLAATLRRFPGVFGFSYGDLVDRVAAEEVALDAAEAAAASGNTTLAGQRIATADRAARAISSGLDHYQRRVERVENANG